MTNPTPRTDDKACPYDTTRMCEHSKECRDAGGCTKLTAFIEFHNRRHELEEMSRSDADK